MTIRAGMAWLNKRLGGTGDSKSPSTHESGPLGDKQERVRGIAPARLTLSDRGIALVTGGWDWFQVRRRAQTRPGRLRVAESVSLGEKRFVAVVELDGQQFLVGGGAATVSLLARLRPEAAASTQRIAPLSTTDEPAFEEVLRQSSWREPLIQKEVSA